MKFFQRRYKKHNKCNCRVSACRTYWIQNTDLQNILYKIAIARRDGVDLSPRISKFKPIRL